MRDRLCSTGSKNQKGVRVKNTIGGHTNELVSSGSTHVAFVDVKSIEIKYDRGKSNHSAKWESILWKKSKLMVQLVLCL
ncbi:hypothetical protein AKA01nite_14490 [Alkalibacterium kapii]|uniref:Uncharacterized protein n=1 Tax=Alkalibacterium kapii TaxID=426704 RepID=A0A511B1Y2_9LACT|nr:hypothetical protein AKA01nite_14490 [Alkalibacterium kapii]